LANILFCYQIIYCQNVGIKTSSPQSALDINGDLSLRKGTLTLSAGPNNSVDISTNKFSVYDFAGGALTGGVQIYGLTGGTDGRIITIFNNSTTAAMQIMDESHPGSANSTAANRIVTGSGNAAVIYQNGSAILRYDGQKQRWTIIGSNYTDGLSAAPAWQLSGNAGITGANFIGTTNNQPLKFRVNNLLAGQLSTSNLGLGLTALYNNSTGYSNVAIGNHALYKNTSNNNLVAVGDSALYNNDTNGETGMLLREGKANTAVGGKALFTNTWGANNTALGFYTSYKNTTGSFNTAVGTNGMYNNTSGYHNTAIGSEALLENTTGNSNTAVGRNAMYKNTSGDYNAATGVHALFFNTVGTQNVAIGSFALYRNTSASYNTATGYESLYANTIGYANTANGYQVLNKNIESSYNTGTGYQSLYFNTIGNFNSAYGSYSLYQNSSGGFNTASGNQSMFNNINGQKNAAMGHNSLYNNQFGSNNVAIGSSSLEFNVSGSNNIAIGASAGTTSSFSNTISIGNDTYLNAYHNQAFLGNLSTGWTGGNTTWFTFSDERIKKDINTDVKGLEFITRLHPVTYYRDIKTATNITGNKATDDYPQKYDIEKIKESGFLAQEVLVAAKTCGYDFSGVRVPVNNCTQ
jgi:trimeric autotransporter adhesin